MPDEYSERSDIELDEPEPPAEEVEAAEVPAPPAEAAPLAEVEAAEVPAPLAEAAPPAEAVAAEEALASVLHQEGMFACARAVCHYSNPRARSHSPTAVLALVASTPAALALPMLPSPCLATDLMSKKASNASMKARVEAEMAKQFDIGADEMYKSLADLKANVAALGPTPPLGSDDDSDDDEDKIPRINHLRQKELAALAQEATDHLSYLPFLVTNLLSTSHP